ncbi:hypothetical protein BDR26DRAFT_874778 [Obelidium mucronatum]|nr:hypothetical protein BDR26DRAFT_874778 [Obelidium mucronatum]
MIFLSPFAATAICCSQEAIPLVPTPTRQTDARALILSPGDQSEEYPQMTLKSYKFQFDTLVLTPNSLLDAPLNLEATNENSTVGRYSILLLSSGQMIAHFPNDTYLPTLYSWQWRQIYDYQKTYGVPLIAINDIPTSLVFNGTVTSYLGAKTCNYVTTLSITTSSKNLSDSVGLTQFFPLVAGDGYQNASCNFPATILDTKAVTPILSFTPNSGVAAAVLDFGNNQRQLSFFFPCGSWSKTCTLLGNVWFQWATRGVYSNQVQPIVAAQIEQIYTRTPSATPTATASAGGSGAKSGEIACSETALVSSVMALTIFAILGM